jgi:hypothetical protein
MAVSACVSLGGVQTCLDPQTRTEGGCPAPDGAQKERDRVLPQVQSGSFAMSLHGSKSLLSGVLGPCRDTLGRCLGFVQEERGQTSLSRAGMGVRAPPTPHPPDRSAHGSEPL